MEKFEFEIWNVPDTKIGQLHGVILEKCPTLVKNATGEFISGILVGWNLKLIGMTLREWRN